MQILLSFIDLVLVRIVVFIYNVDTIQNVTLSEIDQVVLEIRGSTVNTIDSLRILKCNRLVSVPLKSFISLFTPFILPYYHYFGIDKLNFIHS